MNNIGLHGGGNYVIAGADCFASILDNFINKHSSGEFFTDKELKIFVDNSINRFLYSFGNGLSYKTKKISKNHTDKIVREIDKMKSVPFMEDGIIYIDSGGFQVAMGAIGAKDMPQFIETYHNFLETYSEKFDHAFSLDLPPGPGTASEIFESYAQIEELNRLSYRRTANLPQSVKDKMIYIHHFRTPSLYKTWSKFLWDEDLADGFINFATGGIVASMSTDMTIPIIIYTIPLSEIVKYALSKNLKAFNFHVLGGANFLDVFYHKLFSYHIKKVHNIDVKITYDSSAIFKALAIGRFIPVFNNDGNLIKMDLRSKNIHLRFDNTCTIEEKVYELLNEIAEIYGFAKLNAVDHPIYDEERGTFSRCIHMYLICYYLHIYRHLEIDSEKFVEEIYPSFENNKIQDFDDRCYKYAQKLNQGKITKKQKSKISSLYRSLKILTNLDRDYNEFLINKFMAADDISGMDGDVKLTF